MKRIAAGLAAALASLGAGRAGAEAALEDPPAPVEWRRVSDLPRMDGATALAVDAASGALAVGDRSGVLRVAAGGRPMRVLRRGGVRDLAHLDGGDLLAATEQGLYRVGASGRVSRVSPGPGAERSALRIAAEGSAILLGTEDGAYLSLDGARGAWERVAGLPSGPVVAVALRARPRPEGFAWAGGALHRIDVGRARPASSRPERRPPSWREEPIDLVPGLAGADLAILYPSALALRDAPDADWRLLRPTLPPGAGARRIAEGMGRLWLATDRGLLDAPGPAGPWRRVELPGGSREAADLSGAGGALHAVVGDALFAAAKARRDAPRAILAELPAGPPIEHIHRAALDYLDLGPARIGEMRSGVRRRGWLPRAALAGGTSRDRDRGSDVDEAVVSGSFHRFVDQDEGRSRDDSLSLVLTWELGDLFYHPEQIDVSREAREVIELRDDVLDEITQLYFERSRVLAQLAGARTPEEALPLRLRAAELAAGIDAWTGGWFSRALREGGP